MGKHQSTAGTSPYGIAMNIVTKKNGRGGGIRTPDPLLPKQMRYQTALRPDCFSLSHRMRYGLTTMYGSEYPCRIASALCRRPST
jgi:hypothetical protein